jgi:hypothetical protein
MEMKRCGHEQEASGSFGGVCLSLPACSVACHCQEPHKERNKYRSPSVAGDRIQAEGSPASVELTF